MTGPSLLEVAAVAPHGHRRYRHPQTGNPFFPWWNAARFKCELCLAVLRDQDQDIVLSFISEAPWRIKGEPDREWWSEAYLTTLRFVTEQHDREWMRDELAHAIKRGRELTG